MSIEELVRACASGDIKEVKRCVETERVSVHGIYDHTYTPIDTAIEYNKPDVVKYLLEKGAFPDKSILHYSAVCSDSDGLEMIMTLIDADVSWATEMLSVFSFAAKQYAEHGDPSLINKMFESGSKFLPEDDMRHGFSFMRLSLMQYSVSERYTEDLTMRLLAHFVALGCDVNHTLDQEWIDYCVSDSPGLIDYIDALRKIIDILDACGINGSSVEPYIKDICINAVKDGLCDSLEDLKKLSGPASRSSIGI